MWWRMKKWMNEWTQQQVSHWCLCSVNKQSLITAINIGLVVKAKAEGTYNWDVIGSNHLLRITWKTLSESKLATKLSNGHSPANLANSSTRQKFAVFLWLAPANLSSIERIFVTRAGEFVEYWANLANLANLASLANLARVD